MCGLAVIAALPLTTLAQVVEPSIDPSAQRLTRWLCYAVVALIFLAAILGSWRQYSNDRELRRIRNAAERNARRR